MIYQETFGRCLAEAIAEVDQSFSNATWNI